MVAALRDERRDHPPPVALRAREHRRLVAAVGVAPLPQADERDVKVAALSGDDLGQLFDDAELLVAVECAKASAPLGDRFRPYCSIARLRRLAAP
jgi:hypothetical protein